jgi:hypothetical protein
VSYPQNPKTPAIQRLLMQMRSSKEIHLELRVSSKEICDQAQALKLRRVYLTPEERKLIAAKRGMDPADVP